MSDMKLTLVSRVAVVGAFCLAVSATASTNVAAQSYPHSPIRIIVAYPPGGGLDIVVRALSQKLSKSLGQPLVVENRAGAAGMIGTEIAAKAPPDGYTLIMGTNSTHAIMPSLYPKLSYDPIKDFAAVTSVASITNLLVVNPSVAAKSVDDLIALAKAKPGALNYGSAGAGSTTHVAMELFKIMAKINMVHIPYKGLGPAVIDLVAGQTQVMISNAPPVLPFVKSGKLRALAVTGARRLPGMPDLPTVAEAGLPGYEADVWYGLFAPAGTPDAIVRKLNTAVVEVLRSPDVKQTLSDMGAEPLGDTPEEFATMVQTDIVKWAKVVKESGARVE